MSNKLLVIGCGGTGTKIINEMIATLGDDIPNDRLSIVVLDAHQSGYEPGALKAGRANVVTMNGYVPIEDGLQSFVNKLEKKNKGCVYDWFPKEMTFPTEGMYSDGCGAYRPYGKFFSYYYYDNIRQAIGRGLDRLTSSNFMNINQRAQSSRIDVIICASLGNGTGGGIFMDVAAIANEIITKGEIEPRVYGYFVPSSVTYKGPKNNKGHNYAQPYQIAAAGYGALVELQSEFSRKDSNADSNLAPTKHFQAFFYSREADGYKHTVTFEDRNKSPYDGVYLFDRRDDNGITHSYPTIVKTAGQTLAAVIGGEADPEGRLLDIVLRFEKECFSSMGAARLCVPTDKLTDALVGKMSAKLISELCERTNPDLSRWSNLLDLTIGEEQFPPPDPDVAPELEDYVQAFVKKFLRIQEISTEGDGNKSNQLFDLFVSEEEEVKNLIRQVGLSNAEGNEIGQKVNELYTRVGTALAELPKKCENKLKRLKWETVPRENDLSMLDSVENAGVKFLIDSMIQRLVNGNAFGLLEAWLEALWLEVKRNKDSVDLFELKASGIGSSIADIDLSNNEHQKDMQKQKTTILEKTSNTLNRWIGGFVGDSVEDLAIEFEGSAKKSLQFVLWGVKLKAVSDFYDTVLSYIDAWRDTLVKLNNFLLGPDVCGRLREAYEKSSRDLSLNAQSGGVTEYLSCSETAQEHLANELLKNEALQSHNVFADGELSTAIWKIMYSKVDASEQKELKAVFSPNVGGESELTNVIRNRKEVVKGFYGELTNVFRKKLRPHVVPLCKVDNLLYEDSEALVVDYLDNIIEDNASISQSRRKEIENALFLVVPPTTPIEIREILNRSESQSTREEKIKEATQKVFQDRIKQLANAALSKIDTKVSTRGHINGSVSVIYNAQCQKINEIKSSLQDVVSSLSNNMSGSLNAYDDFSSGEILAIGSIHGMTLNDLNITDTYQYYCDAMKSQEERDSRASKNFAPHPTQQYMELGERYLKRGDSVKLDNEEAELVLALACMEPKQKELLGKFGWLKFDKANFKVMRQFPPKLTDGTELPLCMQKMNNVENDRERYLPPQGFEEVIYWFEGSNRSFPDGEAWFKGFKQVFWDEIRLLIFGDPSDWMSETVDISILLDAISDHLLVLEALKKHNRIRKAVEAMIKALTNFKSDLEENKLDENIPPKLLR